MTSIKICGVRSVADALACVDLGADSLGVNFVPSSVRRVDETMAQAIVTAVGAKALVVGVVANMTLDAMRSLRDRTGVGCLQLHGAEPAADVAALLPHAYKAVGVANEADVAYADSMPGDYVLVDAKLEGALGGTGRRVDPSLVADLARRRRLVLAGGLTPENVARAIIDVKPFCVDVASGVERSPGAKDLAKVRAFVQAVRGVDRR